jgi:hypothetical protein
MSSSGADDLFGHTWAAASPVASTPAAPQSPGGGLGAAPQPTAAFSVVHPPLVWLYAATGVGLVALILVLVFWGVVPIAIVGWVLGGPIAIALTSIFQSADTSRRTQIGYSTGRSALARILYIAALVVGLAAVVVAAVTLAMWAGRGF